MCDVAFTQRENIFLLSDNPKKQTISFLTLKVLKILREFRLLSLEQFVC